MKLIIYLNNFAEHPLQNPHIEDARIKMGSRDLHFREATHQKLEEYIQSISLADFDRFLGSNSQFGKIVAKSS